MMLKPFVQSLRFKLTVWDTVVVLLVGVFALVAVRQGLSLTLLHETDGVLRDEAQEIALMIEQTWPDRQAVFEELQRKSSVHVQHGWFVQLFADSGEVVWASPSAPAKTLSNPLGDERGAQAYSAGQYRMVQRRLAAAGLPSFLIRVGTSTEFIDQDVAQLTRIAAPVGLALLLLAPLGGFVLSGRATRPLNKIIATAERLRPSRMSDRLPIRGSGDELDRLSQRINRFLDEIAVHLELHRDFVANAAHELRSPLAALQSAVEIALTKERSVLEYQELLQAITEECEQLTRLVNRLLLLAESDAGHLELAPEPVRLEEIVQRSLDMFAGVASERQVDLVAQLDPDAAVSGDIARLRQVVNNLLDNAIKFTPAGGRVTVQLNADDATNEVRLVIADTGIGIPEASIARVFDRFYQVDRSRKRNTFERGGGLGLSICQSIVNAHQGRIEIASSLEAGTTVVVRLPMHQGISAAPAEIGG